MCTLGRRVDSKDSWLAPPGSIRNTEAGRNLHLQEEEIPADQFQLDLPWTLLVASGRGVQLDLNPWLELECTLFPPKTASLKLDAAVNLQVTRGYHQIDTEAPRSHCWSD